MTITGAIARAHVHHFPMYHIRHIAVSEALARGADLAAVSAAGHSSIATTGTFYAHAIAGAQQRAAAVMPAIDLEEQV